MPADMLQNYFNAIQTLMTFENRNAIRYNRLIIFTKIFQPKRMFSLGRQKNVL